MAIYNGDRIKAPVNLAANVGKLLRTGETRVSGLCTHRNINMWSKYKPIDSSKLTLWTVEDGKLKASDEWEKKLYGMKNKLVWGNITQAFESNTPWGYEGPKGGASSPYRLGDFVNYYHKAVPPFGVAFPSEMKHQSSSDGDDEIFTAVLYIEQSVQGWLQDYCLAFKDCFSSMHDKLATTKYYVTLLMRNKKIVDGGLESTKWWAVSAEKPLNDFLASGNYVKAIPVHFKYKLNKDQNDKNTFKNGDEIECLMCISEWNYGTGEDPSAGGNFYSLNDGNGLNRKTYRYEEVVSLSRFTITTYMKYVVSADHSVEITEVRVSSVRTKGTSTAQFSVVPYFMGKRIANAAKLLQLNGGSVTFSTSDLNAMTDGTYDRKFTFSDSMFGFGVSIRRETDESEVGMVSDGASSGTPLSTGTHEQTQINPDYMISY